MERMPSSSSDWTLGCFRYNVGAIWKTCREIENSKQTTGGPDAEGGTQWGSELIKHIGRQYLSTQQSCTLLSKAASTGNAKDLV